MTWQRRRLQVLERDEYQYSICLRPFTKSDLKVQHLIPRRIGGLDSINNRSAMCSKYHVLTELQRPIGAEPTTIQVTIGLREKLKEIGKKGENYTIQAYQKTLNKK